MSLPQLTMQNLVYLSQQEQQAHNHTVLQRVLEPPSAPLLAMLLTAGMSS
jgi:hypothetical protein